MRGVTSVLASPCLDSLPGPALPSPSRTDWLSKAGISCCAPEACGPGARSCWWQSLCLCLLWKGMGVVLASQWVSSRTALLTACPAVQAQVLDPDSCPIPCPVPSLSPAAREDIRSLGLLLAPWRLQGVMES